MPRVIASRRRWTGPTALRGRAAEGTLVIACLAATYANAAFADDAAIAAPARQTVASTPTPAEDAYDRAMAFYRAGDRVSALAALQESFRLSHEPDLLFDLGRLEREMNHCKPALESYRAYLRAAPESAYAPASRLAIEQLEPECDPPPHVARYWTAPKIVGWSALAAAVGVGIGAFVLQVNAHSDSDAAYDWLFTKGVTWKPRGPNLMSDGIHDQNAAIGLSVTAGTFAVASVLCLTLWAPHREKEAPAVSLAVQPGGALLGYAKRF